jgi:hypothetical protein
MWFSASRVLLRQLVKQIGVHVFNNGRNYSITVIFHTTTTNTSDSCAEALSDVQISFTSVITVFRTWGHTTHA